MLTLAKQCTDLSSGMFPQAVAAMLLDSDLEARHIPEIVDLYRARRDALCAAASEHLGDWFEWDVPPGGMFVWMRAKHPDLDTNELYRHALAENVRSRRRNAQRDARQLHPQFSRDPDGRRAPPAAGGRALPGGMTLL
jgi:DNA-binding transcriptional MocR family regulator